MNPSDLITQLILEGGAIVSSNDCTPEEIATARAENRFAVDPAAFGFVRRTKEWLATHSGQ